MIQEFERLRIRKGWTYVEVTNLLKTNPKAYKQYVNGQRIIKSKRMLRIIEDQLNIHKEKKRVRRKNKPPL